MRRVYKKLLVALSSVSLLAACTNNPITSPSEGSTSQGAESGWMKLISSNAIDKELAEASLQEVSNTLIIENSVGNIEIRRSEDSGLHVRTTLQALNNRSGESTLEELGQNAEVSLITKGKRTSVQLQAKGKYGTDIWSWANKNLGNSHFTVNYVVEVPAQVAEYEISTEVGTISLTGLKGSYDVSNNTGSIELAEVEVDGKSSITSDAGTIRLDLNNLAEGTQLKASTEVGTVTAILPANLAYTLKTATDLGKVSGAAKGKTDINGGGPLLSLQTSLGSISVENK